MDFPAQLQNNRLNVGGEEEKTEKHGHKLASLSIDIYYFMFLDYRLLVHKILSSFSISLLLNASLRTGCS